LFFSAYLAECLGHFEFKTLLLLSSAFCKDQILFLYQAIQPVVFAESAQARVLGPELLLSVKFFFQATMQAAWFLQVPPRSFFKRLVLSTTLCQHSKMSTTLKSPKGLKESKCKKKQLSIRPPVPYVPPIDLVTTKEAPESLMIKLQASQWNRLQHVHLLPREHQGIPCQDPLTHEEYCQSATQI
jgi:hypothetical protein